MLRETGLITELNGNVAIVQTLNKLACSSCKVVDSCGNGIVEKYLAGKIFTSEIENNLGAKVGDEVVIEIPKSSVTKASIVVYLMPLLAFLGAASVASLLIENENTVILISIIGLVFGLFVTKFYNRYFLNPELYLPSMVSIVDTGLSESNCNPINIKEIH